MAKARSRGPVKPKTPPKLPSIPRGSAVMMGIDCYLNGYLAGQRSGNTAQLSQAEWRREARTEAVRRIQVIDQLAEDMKGKRRR